MKEIKRLLEVRLKDLLKAKTNSYEKESLLANAAKTYINSIMMIDDYMKEEQTNKYLVNRINLNR
ncbi:MAG: hypothetical protein KHY73_09185 [Fusobacterium nucleatum]|nr:hypothetical protein [Fusobacterium nucleatum]